MRPAIEVRGSTFVLESSGFGGDPADAVRRFLLERGARRVVSIHHPLVAEAPTAHRVVVDHDDGRQDERSIDPRLHPPLSFVLDSFIPLRTPRADCWIGFNCLATNRALVQRRLGRVRRVVHWSVDFVPNRFGAGVLTRVYEALDKNCCVRADARVDLSDAALRGREHAYGLVPGRCAPGIVVPMGAWNTTTPKVPEDGFGARRIVFLGHLVERMGVRTLLDALDILVERGVPFDADIIGGGPLLGEVRDRASSTLKGRLDVHGFVADRSEVERLLAHASVAVAPYLDDPDSFTRFADPGKLKAYLGAGLPIVTTDVPPIARELEELGGATVVGQGAQPLADAMEHLLEDAPRWSHQRLNAVHFAARFDWNVVLADCLPHAGIDCG